MMPFYYGSKVRSVPEFHDVPPVRHLADLVNALSFAVAQILIAGINLYLLLAHIVELLLGWPLWVSLIVAAIVVLSYIALAGSRRPMTTRCCSSSSSSRPCCR